jgi:hypothetical protein
LSKSCQKVVKKLLKSWQKVGKKLVNQKFAKVRTKSQRLKIMKGSKEEEEDEEGDL